MTEEQIREMREKITSIARSYAKAHSEFVVCGKGNIINIYSSFIDSVSTLIQSECELAVKENTEEMIKLSDEIEAQYETEFNEWRAFKHFRNEMRDKLKSAIRDRDDQLTP